MLLSKAGATIYLFEIESCKFGLELANTLDHQRNEDCEDCEYANWDHKRTLKILKIIDRKDQRRDDSRSTDQQLKPSYDITSDLDEGLHSNRILVDGRLPESEGEEEQSYGD